MKIIDFTLNQIEKTEEKEEFFRHFLHEYGKLCLIPEESLMSGTEMAVQRTDKEKTMNNIEKIKNVLKRGEEKILSFFGEIEIPPVILFIGPLAWDGHGIIVKGKAYIFLNLTMINLHLASPCFIPEVHAIHEIIHGIHYNLLPGYYHGNCKTVKELYFNKLLSEGIATYLSEKINNSTSREALSFGFMSDEDFKLWVLKGLFIKNQLYLLLNRSVMENSYNEELWGNLFLIPDMEPGCLTRGRFGYYYGMKIAEKATEKIGDKSLVKTSQEDLYPFLKDYFSAFLLSNAITS